MSHEFKEVVAILNEQPEDAELQELQENAEFFYDSYLREGEEVDAQMADNFQLAKQFYGRRVLLSPSVVPVAL